jgi:hypothetical protein
MGLRRPVFRPASCSLFKYCSFKDRRPNDGIHVSMVRAGNSVLLFLEEEDEDEYDGVE